MFEAKIGREEFGASRDCAMSNSPPSFPSRSRTSLQREMDVTACEYCKFFVPHCACCHQSGAYHRLKNGTDLHDGHGRRLAIGLQRHPTPLHYDKTVAMAPKRAPVVTNVNRTQFIPIHFCRSWLVSSALTELASSAFCIRRLFVGFITPIVHGTIAGIDTAAAVYRANGVVGSKGRSGNNPDNSVATKKVRPAWTLQGYI